MKYYVKADTLRSLWGLGKRVTLDGTRYRVGKMSYGDYFFEPGQRRRETEPFNTGTLWLEKSKEDQNVYTIQND